MANPCIPALRPHSFWMVCSAPEITTVSKPNKNPARAEVMDQKKMRDFKGIQEFRVRVQPERKLNKRTQRDSRELERSRRL